MLFFGERERREDPRAAWSALVALDVRAAGEGAPPRCLPFFRAACAAFELGRWTLAASDPGIEDEERERRRREAGRYREALRHALAGPAGVAAAPPVRGRFGH